MKTLFALIITLLCISACQSKSGHLIDQPLEKVVIIDSDIRTAYDNGVQYYMTDYKVKRISHGVNDWITINGKTKYESGDTIYHRFR